MLASLASCLLGDEGGGWRMAMKTLEYERGVVAGQASAHMSQSITLEDLMESMHDFERDGAPILEDAMIRDELVKFAIEAKANSISDRRAAIPALNTDYPFGIALSNKYRHTEYARRLKMMGAHVQGAQGALFMDDDQSYKGGFGNALTLPTSAQLLVGVQPKFKPTSSASMCSAFPSLKEAAR